MAQYQREKGTARGAAANGTGSPSPSGFLAGLSTAGMGIVAWTGIVLCAAIALICTIWTMTYPNYTEGGIAPMRHGWLVGCVSAVVLLALLFLLRRTGLFERTDPKAMSWALFGWTLFAAVFWVLFANTSPDRDSLDLLHSAQQLDNPHFEQSLWDYGWYMDRFPYQIPFVLLLRLLLAFFGSNTYLAACMINAIAAAATNLLLVRWADKAFGRQAANMTGVFLFLFLPPVLFSSFMYGNLPAMPFAVGAMLAQQRWFDRPRARTALLAGLLAMMSILLKATMIIVPIAMVIAWLLHLVFKAGRPAASAAASAAAGTAGSGAAGSDADTAGGTAGSGEPGAASSSATTTPATTKATAAFSTARVLSSALMAIVLTLIPCLAGPKVVNQIAAHHYGVSVDDGVPKIAWIAMGLHTEVYPEMPVTPGRYDAFVWKDSGDDYSQEKATDDSIAALKKTWRDFTSDPAYALTFMARKFRFEYADPLYESLLESNWSTTGPARTDPMSARPMTKPLKSVYYGKANKLIIALADGLQLLAFVMAAAAVFIERRNRNLRWMVPLLTCIGLAVIYVFWESKPEYMLPVGWFILPYAAYGAWKAVSGRAHKGWRRHDRAEGKASVEAASAEATA